MSLPYNGGSSLERPRIPLKPRSNKRGRGGLPQMGVNHAVDETPTVDHFFRQFGGDVLHYAPDLIVDTPSGEELSPQFKLRGRKRPHLTVVEGAPVYQSIVESRL
jgi:hypothetical protein